MTAYSAVRSNNRNDGSDIRLVLRRIPGVPAIAISTERDEYNVLLTLRREARDPRFSAYWPLMHSSFVRVRMSRESLLMAGVATMLSFMSFTASSSYSASSVSTVTMPLSPAR